MNVLRQQDPSDASYADYAWRTGTRTYSEAKRELDAEIEAMMARFQPPALVGVTAEYVDEYIQ